MNDSLNSDIRALLARLDDQVPLPPPFETLREWPVAPSPNRKAVFVASGGLVAATTVGVAVLTSQESSEPASNVAPTAPTTAVVASQPTQPMCLPKTGAIELWRRSSRYRQAEGLWTLVHSMV